MDPKRIQNYAHLIASVGGNVKAGDEVVIRAELDCPDFVCMVAEECYKLGAEKVNIDWTHQPFSKIDITYKSEDILGRLEEYEICRLKYRRDRLPVMLYLISEDPDGLKGIDQNKYAAALQERYKIIKPIRDAMDSRYKWCIAAVPGIKWAKKVFPHDDEKSAVEKLWEAILFTSRVDDDPVLAWKKHNDELQYRCDYLNALQIESLEYNDPNGTHLQIGMIPDALFMGGGEYTLSGEFFNPNIPSEEIFITPMRGKADGIVYSSRPLSYNGELIENFSIRFENGKAVQVQAEKNEELLQRMITMDEGASYLGECALVPYNSPIRESNLLFYNTLFDENAACHLALGEGFANCIKNYDKYTLQECREKGINSSLIHEDFMIGTATLNISAHTRDGKCVPIFRKGNWAF